MEKSELINEANRLLDKIEAILLSGDDQGLDYLITSEENEGF